MAQISEEEKLRRRQGNDCVMGTTAMSGAFPDAITLSLFERFAEGEFTREELSEAIDRHVMGLVLEAQARQAKLGNRVQT